MSMCKYLDHLEKVLGGTYLVISIKLFLIIIVAIIFLSLEPSTGKDQPCIMMYTFENASLTPSDNVINNGWQPDEQSHSGKRSFASTRKGVNKFRMINVSGPAYITFWWKSDIHKVKNFFYFRLTRKLMSRHMRVMENGKKLITPYKILGHMFSPGHLIGILMMTFLGGSMIYA